MKALLVVIPFALSMSTTSNGSEPVDRQPTSIQIRFEARVGDRPFRCADRYDGVGITGATILPQDFRLYVSDIRLLKADGSATQVSLTPDDNWQSDKVALLDFENDTGNCSGSPGTNAVVRGTVPKGDYTGLLFTIGVPAELNHLDPTLAKAPLNRTDLFWPWRIGYKFTSIAFDSSRLPPGTNMPGPDASTFSIILGSMDCGDGSWDAPPNGECRSPNRPTFRLESFNVERRSVILDLAGLVSTSDVSVRPPNSDSGCWSFTENNDCVTVMSLFGLPFRGQPSGGQKFVR